MFDAPLPDGAPVTPLSRPASAVVTKRLFDVAVGLLLSVLALPIILILALGVAFCLRTWPFFTQQRVGYLGRPFTIIKLRTLPKIAPRYASKFDLDHRELRTPALCRLLRAAHLDELPQLWLVPLGTMSLVGPRPLQGHNIEPLDPGFGALRHMVRPGCTGVWQIGTDSGLLPTDSPTFDVFYLSHACLRLDVWVLWRTALFILHVAKPIGCHEVPRWALGAGYVAFTWASPARPLSLAPPRQPVEGFMTVLDRD